jgi:acyl-CoA thioester hydrolase
MKLEVPAQKTLVHTVTVPIRWGDMDALGHVNNIMYFRYMEIARIGWMNHCGYRAEPTSSTFVVANVFCNFLRQFEYPGDVLVSTYVGAVGRSSFDTYHEMRRTDSGDIVYANGGATIVWVDALQQKSIPLPESLRQLLPQ